MLKTFAIISASLCMFSVIIGAFGAHSLNEILTKNEALDTFNTGVRYLFIHSISALFLSLLADKLAVPQLRIGIILFYVGIILFSGSLFAIGMTGIRKFGMIAPIGGLSFIAGWFFVILSILKSSYIK